MKTTMKTTQKTTLKTTLKNKGGYKFVPTADLKEHVVVFFQKNIF